MSFGVTRPTEPTNPSTSIGGGSSVSGGSSSSSSWRDPSFIWEGQAPYLEGLYSRGAEQWRDNTSRARGRDMYNQARGALGNLLNPGVNPQLAAYAGDVQRNFQRNVLPTIQGQAAGFGQLGGGRQGIAEGLAASDANQQVTDMAANLYNQDMNRMSQAMQFAPMLGAFGMNIPWYGLQQYAGILGRPTVMQGAAGSESSSSNFGSSEEWNYGYGGGGGGGGGGFNIGGWD
jgi:hypothetical protein